MISLLKRCGCRRAWKVDATNAFYGETKCGLSGKPINTTTLDSNGESTTRNGDCLGMERLFTKVLEVRLDSLLHSNGNAETGQTKFCVWSQSQ